VEQRKKKEKEKEKEKEDKKEDRLEGQRPCQGGRYREFPNGDTIIQCNCNFFCTSAIDGKTRKRKVLPKLPKGQSYPYYYDCHAFDKIPGWDPWHTPKKEDSDNKQETASQGSSSNSGGGGSSKIIALCIITFVALTSNPLVGATCTKGPEPSSQGNLTQFELRTLTFTAYDTDFRSESSDTCYNPNLPALTAFDFVVFKHQLETFRESVEKERLAAINEYDKCLPVNEHLESYFEEIRERAARARAEWRFDPRAEEARQQAACAAEQERDRQFDDLLDSIEADRLIKEREAVTSDDNPINPYVEQFLYSTTEADRLFEEQQAKIDEIRKFNDIVQKQIHELHFRTEQVLVATENAIKANDDMIRRITGPGKLEILLLLACALLPTMILHDLDTDPDGRNTCAIISTVHLCHVGLVMCAERFSPPSPAGAIVSYLISPVVTGPLVALYLVLWLRVIVRGGCVPRVDNVW
jgi:hypothetical protein